jgi:SAM-dependent methyltransferase
MKHVSCNYCGHDKSELVNSGPDMLLNKGHFTLVRCLVCGLIYQNPQPSLAELAGHYPEEYPRFITAPTEESSLSLNRLSADHALARQRQRLERHFAGPGRLLDVGCATGQFLSHMREAGWEVTGVEFSPHAAAFARQQYGLDVRTGTLENVVLPEASIDVVTMWDVLEHVPDPKGTLKEIARILRPGGLLVVSTPNPTSLEARLFGPHWIGWERPRHLHIFPPNLLRHYVDDAGFTTESLESFSGRLSVTLVSLVYWFKARNIPEEKWQPWLRRAYNWPLRLATWPIYRLGEALNKTTTMTLFARLTSRVPL